MNRRPPQAGKRRRRGANPGNQAGPGINGNGGPVSEGGVHSQVSGPGGGGPGGHGGHGGHGQVRVIAHRGHRAQAPENTLKSLREALRAGARYLSIDVQVTADGVPVLFADNDLERICGRDGKVCETASSEFLALKAAESWRFGGNRQSGEPTATLAQALMLLAEHPEVFLFVEVKDGSVQRHGAAAVYEAVAPLLRPFAERVALISFDEDFLLHARERGEFRLGAVLREWEEREVSAMRIIDPEYLFCDARGIPDTGRLAWGQAEIGIFEVDEARKVQELARRGVSYVETFLIAEMLQQLARLGSRSERRPLPHRQAAVEGGPQRREPREAREGGREPREPREAREGREPREAREGREGRDLREGREGREPREPREGREPREHREPRGDQQPREAPPEPLPALTVPQEDSGNTLRLSRRDAREPLETPGERELPGERDLPEDDEN